MRVLIGSETIKLDQDALENIRRVAGLSKAEVARRLGIGWQCWARAEQRRNPSLRRVIETLRACGLEAQLIITKKVGV